MLGLAMKLVLHVGEGDHICPVSPSGPGRAQEADPSHPSIGESRSPNTQQTCKRMSTVNIPQSPGFGGNKSEPMGEIGI